MKYIGVVLVLCAQGSLTSVGFVSADEGIARYTKASITITRLFPLRILRRASSRGRRLRVTDGRLRIKVIVIAKVQYMELGT